MKIKCKTQDTLPISALTEFQGGLKARTNEDYEKITRSIEKHGFSFPFFVWRIGNINYVLDGHGRLGALQRLVAKGEQLPDLPIVYVDCKDEAEAKEILLKLNSQYGTMTTESVLEFLDGIKIDFEEIALPSSSIDFFEDTKIENIEFPKLAEDERNSICTWTFTITQEQKELIEKAIKVCKPFTTKENGNGNGNALAKICEEYLCKSM